MNLPYWPPPWGFPWPATLARERVGPVRICIDPGHGGTDPGALYDGIREAAVVLDYAHMLRDDLERRGHRVMLTRETDLAVPLLERAQLSNLFEADCFLSLHCNASTNHAAWGAWTIHANGSVLGRRLADNIFTELEALDGVANPAGVRKVLADATPWVAGRRLTVLRRTIAPSVLLELGFLSNADERERLISEDHRAAVCWAIRRGLEAWKASEP